MLALTRRVSVPDAPNVVIYGDDEDPCTYYAVPARPALDVDDRGRPACRVLVYMKRNGGEQSPVGGQVTLTTVLEMTPEDAARVTRALESGVANGIRLDPPCASRVRLVNPDWLSGVVTVELGPSLTMTGQPSLSGANRCAMTAPLSADQARRIHDEGGGPLAATRIRYVMETRVGAATSSSATATAHASGITGGVAGDVARAFTLDARIRSAVRHSMVFEGPVASGSLDGLITHLDL